MSGGMLARLSIGQPLACEHWKLRRRLPKSPGEISRSTALVVAPRPRPRPGQPPPRSSLWEASSELLARRDAVTFGVATVVAAAAGATWVMSSRASPANQHAAMDATRRGMVLFRQADVSGSIAEFDKAMELDPRQKPYLWQRGLSLYYAGRYVEAAEQFRADVAVNPNDTEEAIWCFLSEAMESNPEEASKTFLEVGRDSRPIMRTAYELFQGSKGVTVDQLIQLASQQPGSGSQFYGLLYAGLYFEAQRDEEKAKQNIISATETPYAVRSGDYMAALANVHCIVRGWKAA